MSASVLTQSSASADSAEYSLVSVSSPSVPELESEPGRSDVADAPGGAAAAIRPLDPIRLSVAHSRSRLAGEELLAVSIIAPVLTSSHQRIPSDIICTIDVSGSMDSPVVIPGNAESSVFSTLDLVKHALLTIIESLNASDRLALVAFSDRATIVLPLTEITSTGKQQLADAVKSLHTLGSTNLYDGILKSLELFDSIAAADAISEYRNRQIFVLTDGAPNISPPKGIIEELQSHIAKNPLKCSISTFGFGYSLDSQMLEKISEVGVGSSMFIPDGSFVGTIFVNAIANAVNSIASEMELIISHDGLKVGKELVKAHTKGNIKSPQSFSLKLDPLRLGQNKGLVFPVSLGKFLDSSSGSKIPNFTATLKFNNLHTGKACEISEIIHLPNIVEAAQIEGAGAEGESHEAISEPEQTETHPFNTASEPTESKQPEGKDSLESDCSIIINYARLSAVALIRNLLTKFKDGDSEKLIAEFEGRMKTVWMPAVKEMENKIRLAMGIKEEEEEEGDEESNEIDPADDTRSNSRFLVNLLADISGQVRESVAKAEAYNRWGSHYLRSLSRAHLQQLCNNFKDPGVQSYGSESFRELREKMNEIFIALPAPEPSLQHYSRSGNVSPSSFSNMAMFNNSSGGCFAGDALVLMADGNQKPTKLIRAGDRIRSANGLESTVLIAAEFGCENGRAKIVILKQFQNLGLTAFHPIRLNGEWKFPLSLIDSAAVDESNVKFISCPAVFNFVLDSQHSLMVNGVEACTLGHNFTDNAIISHPFFGSNRVVEDLKQFDSDGTGNIRIAAGASQWTRNPTSGLIDGLKSIENSGNEKQMKSSATAVNYQQWFKTLVC